MPELRLPKNVRQIGDTGSEDRKIYVEDFVMSYVKRFGTRDLKYGVLLGDIVKQNGNTYYFISGAVCAKPVIDNEIVFDEDIWTGIYSEIKTYFEGVEIVGWFLSMPGLLAGDLEQIRKIHLNHFAGNDKVCFVLDRMECEDTFYVYRDGDLKKLDGHYIYYEKNADMQSYMVVNEEINEIPADYEQSKKSHLNATVHRLLYKIDRESKRAALQTNDRKADQAAEDLKKNNHEDNINEKKKKISKEKNRELNREEKTKEFSAKENSRELSKQENSREPERRENISESNRKESLKEPNKKESLRESGKKENLRELNKKESLREPNKKESLKESYKKEGLGESAKKSSGKEFHQREGFRKKNQKVIPMFVYSASSFMLAVVLLATVSIMRTSGQLKDIKNMVSKMANAPVSQTSSNTKIVDVAANVTTSMEGDKPDDPKNRQTIGNAESVNKAETEQQTKKPTTDQEEKKASSESETKAESKASDENKTATEGKASDENKSATEGKASDENKTTTESKASAESNTKTDGSVREVKSSQFYIVKKGDSLYSISKEIYGDTGMIDRIREANKMKETDSHIWAGQKLILP